RLIHEILALSFQDNVKARFLQADGSYRRAKPAVHQRAIRSQFAFIKRAVTETEANKTIDGNPKYPRMKVATSPFGTSGRPA
ncbi:MAG TPA: RNA degradosome polyphosphate kinase, partial [Candidatus Dormibacteraeota bacterium]|nr:RNA degradosome polyphosphate kinase [Candidatus Dormibacteraeota bacterium]